MSAAHRVDRSRSSPTSTATCPPSRRASQRIEELGIERGLLRRGPRRLRPPSQRGLRPDRGARDPDDLRQLRLRDRPRLTRTAAARTRRSTIASSASTRWTGRSRTPVRASKDFMRGAAVRPALRSSASASPARPRLAAQGQRVPVRGQAGHDLYERLARAEDCARAGLRPHPQALDPRVRRGAVRQLRIRRQAEGRRPARRLRRPRARRRRSVQARIERIRVRRRVPSRARSPPPGCRASTPRSCWSRPESGIADDRSPPAAPARRVPRLSVPGRRRDRLRDRGATALTRTTPGSSCSRTQPPPRRGCSRSS